MVKLALLSGIVLVAMLFSAGCFSSTPTVQDTAVTTMPTTVSPVIVETTIPVTTITTIPITEPTEEVLTAIPAIPASPQLKIIKRITGTTSTFSENVSVPYTSWELWYTADPLATGGQDSHSAEGSQSAVFPQLKILVKDLRTGTIVEIEPPGGLDEELWQKSSDPRPWRQKIYSGNSEYNIFVNARHITSYTLEVRVAK